MTYTLLLETPVGPLTVTATKTAVTEVRFGTQIPGDSILCTGTDTPVLLHQAAQELREYFSGTRRTFTLPLAPAGTEFQKKVWKALQTIPYGETRTYKQIAIQIGHNQSFRAVGMANNRNPIAIVVPCHRVVGSTGALVGYAGGLSAKTHLLNLEKGTVYQDTPPSTQK